MRDPMVSVVIPTYNREHCLRDAIYIVLAQSFQNSVSYFDQSFISIYITLTAIGSTGSMKIS